MGYYDESATANPEADPWSLPLEDIDLAQGVIFKNQKHHEYFRRLRPQV